VLKLTERDHVADRLAVEPHQLSAVAEEREVGVGHPIVEADGALGERLPLGEVALALGARACLATGFALVERLTGEGGGRGLRRERSSDRATERRHERETREQTLTHAKGGSCKRATSESTRTLRGDPMGPVTTASPVPAIPPHC
jgi:hypothetical protein